MVHSQLIMESFQPIFYFQKKIINGMVIYEKKRIFYLSVENNCYLRANFFNQLSKFKKKA